MLGQVCQQAITVPDADLLLIGHPDAHYNELSFENQAFTFTRMTFENSICGIFPILFEPQFVNTALSYFRRNTITN